MVRGWLVPAFGDGSLVDGGVASTLVARLEVKRGVDLGAEDPGYLAVEVDVPALPEVVIPVLGMGVRGRVRVIFRVAVKGRVRVWVRVSVRVRVKVT